MPEHPVLGGTDGFRGTATLEPGSGLMNSETVAGLTYALVDMQRDAGESPLVVVGYDTRPSGPGLERAAVAGAVAAGAEVLRMGIAPTPAILKTAQLTGAAAAVSLTASHNKAPDNGWKGTLGEHKPVDGQVKEISDRYWAFTDGGLAVPLDPADSVPERPDLREAYASLIVAEMENEFGEQPLDGKVVVVDGANGAAKDVTPGILGRLGATVYTYACDGDRPINEGSGATHLEGAKAFLEEHPEIVDKDGFIGVVLHDGDADRNKGLGATIENSGKMRFVELDGNRVMELLAEGQPGTVGTEYTNDASVARLRKQGIGFTFCPNGDVNVTKALRDTARTEPVQWTRGSEYTGHHVNLRHLSSGDGVRTGAWTACYAAQKNTTFTEIGDSLPLWPQTEVEVPLSPNVSPVIKEHPIVAEAIGAAELTLAGAGGRVITRPSGTQAGVFRVWGSSEDPQLTNRVVGSLVRTIEDVGAPEPMGVSGGPVGSRTRAI